MWWVRDVGGLPLHACTGSLAGGAREEPRKQLVKRGNALKLQQEMGGVSLCAWGLVGTAVN